MAAERKDLTEKYTIHVAIKDTDIDINGHVNNIVYLHWIQDAAIAHWSILATKEELEQIVWVVTRHEIDYKTALHKGDEVIARTWVGRADALRFERFTEIMRTEDNKIAANARTLWVPINRHTGKIIRVDAEVRKRFSIE
jgi:acyl-CoA thioester hydrolase